MQSFNNVLFFSPLLFDSWTNRSKALNSHYFHSQWLGLCGALWLTSTEALFAYTGQMCRWNVLTDWWKGCKLLLLMFNRIKLYAFVCTCTKSSLQNSMMRSEMPQNEQANCFHLQPIIKGKAVVSCVHCQVKKCHASVGVGANWPHCIAAFKRLWNLRTEPLTSDLIAAPPKDKPYTPPLNRMLPLY